MADETEVLTLRDDFYRDSFTKLVWIILAVALALVMMLSLSLYLYLSKPPPVTFTVGEEWRIQEPVPLDQPYRTTADMLQWVSDALPNSFDYDFVNYNAQIQVAPRYFTAKGWKAFLNHLNNYVNYNNVQSKKMFVSGAPASAPFVLNQGLILGRYGWWVQMPVTISYRDSSGTKTLGLTMQVLVVRVPTLNNLAGIGIDDVIVVKNP